MSVNFWLMLATFSLFVAIPSFAHIVESDFTCPSREADGGLHADPEDCSKFYQCSNGVAYQMSCPAGLVFNPNISICDFDYNVACVTEFTCPNKEADGGLYADPEDCSKFYQCSSGIGYQMSCPAGLVFNPRTSICDYDDNTVCAAGPTSDITDGAHDSDGSLRLQVNPAKLELGLTQNLRVICSIAQEEDNTSLNMTLDSLTLSRHKSNSLDDDTEFTDLASVHSLSGNKLFQHPASGKAVVTGSVRKEGQSFISLVWERPTSEEAQTYKCVAAGVDDQGRHVAFSKIASVEASVHDAIILLDKVQLLQQKLDHLSHSVETDIDNLTTELKDTNKKVNNLYDNFTAEISDTKEKVNNLHENLTAELSDTKEKVNNLHENLTAELSNTNENVNNLQEHLTAEISDTKAKVNNLQKNLTSELSDTKEKVYNLQENLTNGLTDTRQKVNSLQQNLTAELSNTNEKVKGLQENLTNGLTDTRKKVNSLKENLTAKLSNTNEKVNNLDSKTSQMETTLKATQEDLKTLISSSMSETSTKVQTLSLRLKAMRSALFHPPSEFKDRRYYLSKQVRGNNIYTAEARCAMIGGYLAEMNNLDEYRFVHGVLKKYSGFLGVYLGGTDAGHEGKWVFQHSKERVKFFKWAPRQPDNAGGNENCLGLWKAPRLTMNDFNCETDGYLMSFLCEVPNP